MNTNTKTISIKSSHERPREEKLITKHFFHSPLTIQPKKILIKGKARKIFDSLDIPLPKKDNQKAVLRAFIKSLRETCDTLNKELETQYDIDKIFHTRN